MLDYLIMIKIYVGFIFTIFECGAHEIKLECFYYFLYFFNTVK